MTFCCGILNKWVNYLDLFIYNYERLIAEFDYVALFPKQAHCLSCQKSKKVAND